MTQVEVSTLDVSDLAETEAMMQLAHQMAPVGGIFHLAMVLTDKLLANQVRSRLDCPTIP